MKHKNISNKRFLSGILAVVAVVSTFAPAFADKRLEDKRKAEYVYLEAVRKGALGERDANYLLLKRAMELDPEETLFGTEVGFTDIVLYADNDSAMLYSGLEKMRRHFDKSPADYYSSLTYGTVVNRLGQLNEAIRVWTKIDSLFPDKPDVAASLADALTASRDTANIRKAIDIYNRLETSMGQTIPLSTRKIASLMTIGDSVAALNEIIRMVESSPNDAETLVAAGDINMALQRPDSALVYFNMACAADSTNGPAFYKRAACYQVLGDSTRYEAEIREALTKDNLDLDVKLELLRVYLTDVYSDTLRRADIENIFSKLTEAYPHEADVRKLFTSYYVAIKDFPSAAEQQSYALDIDPSEEQAWEGLISLYISADNVNGQIEAAKRALRYFPDNSRLTWMLSMSELQNENYEKAISDAIKAYNLALASDSTNTELLSNITCSVGDAYYQAEKTDSAFIYYEKSIAYNPENYLALNNCAYYLACENRDLDRAEEMISLVIGHSPDNPTSLDTYAWVLFRKHEYKTARDFIEKAVELEEKPSGELLHHAGDIFFMVGEPAKAVEFWAKALELEPTNKLLEKKVKNKTYYYE